MIIFDKVKIRILSGKGGNNKKSFIKIGNKLIHSGGKGGCGGDIFIKLNKKINNLNFFLKKKIFISKSGESGKSNFRKGKNGNDLIINLPYGTIIRNSVNNKIIFNLFSNKNLLIKGGQSWKFNKYKNFNFKGSKGFEINLILNFNILSHIILVGFPNVGKSTFINSVSNTNSKVNNYIFTTLNPILGILKFNFIKKIIILDLPGIIKNSYNNVGLGLKFLKYFFYNKIIFYFLDYSFFKFNYKNINILNNEIYKYNKYYFYKPIIIFFNKIDLIYNSICIKEIKNIFSFIKLFYYIIFISSLKQNFYKKIFFIIYSNILF